ncbi:MAG: hypothetical protein MUO72_16190 [Bacteroidales bacterium]|nr:hypothetical protein [Bacteroidales bacterium]
MTAQEREVLYYNGKTYWLSTEPLKPLLDIIGDEKPSSSAVVMASTSCRRGYIGDWEIVEDRLFLIGLKGCPEENERFTMDFLFPNQQKVFAGWFTGEIKIPQGKVLVHDDTTTLHEKDWYLEFDKGIIVGSREVDNTKTFNPDDPYGIKDLIIDLP